MKFFIPLVLFFFSAQLSAQNFPILLDCPELTGTASGASVSLTIFNQPNSNNYNESFNVYDPRIQNAPDTSWDFEGYIVYQIAGCYIPTPFRNHMFDTNIVRIVAQSDIANGIGTLVNHQPSDSCAAKTMVAGADAGIQHTFTLTTDAFTGLPLQPNIYYPYIAIAYAYNAYFADSACAPLTSPFLPGVHEHFFCIQLTGINELQAANSLTVFPSPATGFLTVDLSGLRSETCLRVLDISGQTVQAQAVNEGENYLLDVSALTPGIYFLEAVSEEKVFRGRFVKE